MARYQTVRLWNKQPSKKITGRFVTVVPQIINSRWFIRKSRKARTTRTSALPNDERIALVGKTRRPQPTWEKMSASAYHVKLFKWKWIERYLKVFTSHGLKTLFSREARDIRVKIIANQHVKQFVFLVIRFRKSQDMRRKKCGLVIKY